MEVKKFVFCSGQQVRRYRDFLVMKISQVAIM